MAASLKNTRSYPALKLFSFALVPALCYLLQQLSPPDSGYLVVVYPVLLVAGIWCYFAGTGKLLRAIGWGLFYGSLTVFVFVLSVALLVALAYG